MFSIVVLGSFRATMGEDATAVLLVIVGRCEKCPNSWQPMLELCTGR